MERDVRTQRADRPALLACVLAGDARARGRPRLPHLHRAKHAERIIANTLRQELVGEPVRVIEIAPGMVRTEEFSLNRLGSQEAADRVYEGVAQPLVAEDVAEAIVWTLERPSHVNIDSMIVRPVAQATNTLVARNTAGE